MAKRAGLSAFLAAFFGSALALGSGITTTRFGGEHGHPMTWEATSTYYNPAAMAGSKGGNAMVDLPVAWRHATYVRPTSDSAVPVGAEGSNTGRATLFNLIPEPFVGATYRIADFAFGLSWYTPFGGQSAWNQNDRFRGNSQYPGAVDGVQRWYAIEGQLRSSYFTVAGAYRLGAFAVGISGNLIQTSVNTIQARESTGSDDVRFEGRAWLDATGWDASAGIGVTYEPIPRKLLFGLSYQSRPNFGGGIRATGKLETILGGTKSTEDVAFTTDLPDIVRAGVAFRPSERVELRLFGNYDRWSVLRRQCVFQEDSRCRINADGSAAPGDNVILNTPRQWNDTFGVRAGASYFMTPDLEVLAGAGFGSKAIPDKTLEPALLDFDAFTASLGAYYALGKAVRLGATYTQVFYLSRDTTGKSMFPGQQPPSRSPDSGGKYSAQLGLLNANVNVAF